MTSQKYTTTVLCMVCACLIARVHAAAPVISGLPVTLNVGENEDSRRLFHVLSVVDPDGDSFTCNMASFTSIDTSTNTAVAVNGEFSFIHDTDGYYKVYVEVAASGVFKPVQDYYIAISCTDVNGDTSTGTTEITVDVFSGQDLTFTNIPASEPVSAAAKSAGDSIKAISAINDLGLPMQYEIVSADPASLASYFSINQGNGELTASKDLETIAIDTPSVTLDIRVTEGQLYITETYTMTFTNQNTRPSVQFSTNLATSLTETKLENEYAAGDTVFTLSTVDIDSGETYTYRYTCVPSGSETVFTLSSVTTVNSVNFNIDSGMSLDFETFPSIVCSFYVHDGKNEGGPFVYDLTVENDNDTPEFSNTMYYVTTTEGAARSVTFTPGFVCTDQDINEVLKYSLDDTVTGYGNFDIDASTGKMTFAVNYDTDNGMDTTVVLGIRCTDDGTPNSVEKTGTTQVTITIEDDNDETPIFNPVSVTLGVSQSNSAGDILGTMGVTDADPGTNGQFSCSGTSGDLNSAYFSVNSNCGISLVKPIDFSEGTVTQYVVTAVDGGSPALTGTGTVDIIFSGTTTTSTTTTTTSSYDFWDNGASVAAFVLALLAGLALLGILLWCLLTKCCLGGGGKCCPGQCCERRPRRYPRREVTPARPRTPIRRELTPEYREKPVRVVEERQPVRVIRTFGQNGPPQYGSWRSAGPPPIGGFLRSAPMMGNGGRFM